MKAYEFLSFTQLFKVGIGPSSSHTMGPMVAGRRFRNLLRGTGAARIEVRLLGSLAFTGKGHATDRAVALGLLGFDSATMERDKADRALSSSERTGEIALPGGQLVSFRPSKDIVFDYDTVPTRHPNTMTFRAQGPDGNVLLEKTYLSIGGGFVTDGEEDGRTAAPANLSVPMPFGTAAEMLSMARKNGLSIAQLQLANERAAGLFDVVEALDGIAAVMHETVDRGLAASGELPGGLRVERRARSIHERLQAESRGVAEVASRSNEWLSVFAMAVNEENAAGGRIVTAPTNGAAGVIPAVLRYAQMVVEGFGPEEVRTFLLTAAAIGSLIKANASISGAEVGCQGEVGSASAMAAAGMASILGASPEQVANAAEMALEHHLGMTCDPIGGLVQVPCIERNAFGAVKAVTAASLSRHGTGRQVVSLDVAIETMRQTGRDMANEYKETSLGGLASNISVGRTEC
ncbi:L-serine ammonia-lyase [Aestuariibius insulae]|uniref:L-serine ammonia-lyase n=1 Tax=Aestuariibius insulae TaxID=2058287 RepID=UPI003480969E